MTVLLRILVTILASVLIVVGIVWTISPLPFGFVLVVLGVLLLAAAAPVVLRWFRRRWRWLDRKLARLQEILPRWLARHLRRSDPSESGR